jgi:hypothetical protein
MKRDAPYIFKQWVVLGSGRSYLYYYYLTHAEIRRANVSNQSKLR